MSQTLLRSGRFRLFLISFLVLFLELVCIRWFSSYVLYLGYFTNFVLLGALLGIGAGALLSPRSTRLIVFLPALLFILVPVILFSRPMVNPLFEDYIYFASSSTALWLPEYVLLPLIFISVALIFTFLAQELGGLLNQFPPLQSYNLNILGSLAGIACFTIISFLSLPSWIWFLVVALSLIPFLPRGRSFRLNILLLAGVVIFIGSSDYSLKNIWSPYYRLNLMRVDGRSVERVDAQPTGERSSHYILQANGAGHQAFTSIELNPPFYQLPYSALKDAAYRDVLVIGAGGGNDVATALKNNVQNVDAVEIDPRILELGRQNHPERPYEDPRVTVYADDARSYMQKTDKKYDLIIYALPDSLILATNFSSLRLESYLFTREAFQSVKDHLKADGLFVLYNYYRFDWLVEKISSMLTEVFDEQPYYFEYTGPEFSNITFVTMFAGPRSSALDLTFSGFTRTNPTQFEPATDNWPFLYMKAPSLPGFYSRVLVLMLIFSTAYIWVLSPKGAINRQGWPFFFMGAAFMLLETRSIVQFLLLFGSTWLVNALVFFAILLMVLLANWLAARHRFSRLWMLYVLLFLSLALNFALPLKSILFDNVILRYGTATALLLSPIFFANLIYSTFFRDTERANIAFGANLLGTMIGGATEYMALYFGYQYLILIAGCFYLLAFLPLTRMRARSTLATSS
jgi:SAM-dependent methyltransferase